MESNANLTAAQKAAIDGAIEATEALNAALVKLYESGVTGVSISQVGRLAHGRFLQNQPLVYVSGV